MEDKSILKTVKKLLGIPEDVDDFDKDIIIYINTVFSLVNQMGIGPLKCFSISGKDEKWSDFSERLDMEQFKTYVYLKVKMLFDPPVNSQLASSYNNTINELEFRISSLWDRYMNSDDEEIKNWVDANKKEV